MRQFLKHINSDDERKWLAWSIGGAVTYAHFDHMDAEYIQLKTQGKPSFFSEKDFVEVINKGLPPVINKWPHKLIEASAKSRDKRSACISYLIAACPTKHQAALRKTFGLEDTIPTTHPEAVASIIDLIQMPAYEVEQQQQHEHTTPPLETPIQAPVTTIAQWDGRLLQKYRKRLELSPLASDVDITKAIFTANTVVDTADVDALVAGPIESVLVDWTPAYKNDTIQNYARQLLKKK